MRTYLVVAAALAVAPAARAAQAVPVSVEDLALHSDLVVEGEVVDVRSAWSADGLRILTTAEIHPSAAWVGEARGRVKVVVPGGVVGDVGQRVDGAPSFAKGEAVVVFLRAAEAGAYRVTGLAQGKFRVEGAQARPDLSRVQLLAAPLRAGHRASGPMPVDELRRRVGSAR